MNRQTRPISREEYERDLAKRREALRKKQEENWQPCAHDACKDCAGTGRKADGSPCVHYLVCYCPKCSCRYTAQWTLAYGNGSSSTASL